MPRNPIDPQLVSAIRESARPLAGSGRDYDALLERIGDSRFVLLGEASHGTHEFYRERARITQRLIREKGFTAVAVEADWPDAYRVNRYVKGFGPDHDAIESLDDFQRFPLWMWRNADVLNFIGWLREHNEHLPRDERIGFYGVDLYSLYASLDAVIRYLEGVDKALAAEARRRYACFDHFREDPQDYGHAAWRGDSCEQEVVHQLQEIRKRAGELKQKDGRAAAEDYFYAEQNARLVESAERYYRTMFEGGASSWNLRDRHMSETIDQLAGFLERHGPGAKIVVWEHNSHLGDARATERVDEGELNVGQLLRERHPEETFLVGFTTNSGTVTAASWWGGNAERKRVRPALPDSYEALFHEVGLPRFWLPLGDGGEAVSGLDEARLERAIGVIYRPETERMSHYFHARLPRQFDAVLHFDETRAVEPLERTPHWTTGEPPETYPSGL